MGICISLRCRRNVGELSTHLVKRLVKFGELCCLGHDRFVHKKGGLHLFEAPITQIVQSIVDKSEVKIHSVTREEEGSVPGNLGP